MAEEEVVPAPAHTSNPAHPITLQREVFDGVLTYLRDQIDASLRNKTSSENMADKLGNAGVEAKPLPKEFLDAVRIWNIETMTELMDGDHQLMLIPCTWGDRAYGNDKKDFAAVCTIFQLAVLLNSGKMVGEMLRIFIRKVRYSPRQLKDLFEQRFEAYGNEISAWDTARVSGNRCILKLFEMASEGQPINFEDTDYYAKLKEEQHACDGLDDLNDLDPILQFKENLKRDNSSRFDILFGPRGGYDTRWWGAPYGISLPIVKDYLFVLHWVTSPSHPGMLFFESICSALGRTHTTRLLKLTDHNGQTPLHTIAAQMPPGVSVDSFKFVVMNYCEPNFNPFDVRDLAGRTCLHYAAANDDMTKWYFLSCLGLTDASWKKLVSVPFGELETTALQLAVKHSRYLCVKWLVEDGCDDINQRCSLKVTLRGPDRTQSQLSVRRPFQMAALAGHLRILKLFLKQSELDTTPENYSFDTVPALHLAAIGGNPLSVKILLDSGKIDPFTIHRQYGTALHFVAGWELEDLDTLTASDFVTVSGYSGHTASKKLKTPDANQKGRSLGGIMGCMDMLMQAGLDMEQEDYYGQTPQLMSSASDELSRWWYDKLARQNQEAKTNLVAAANAVSVTAALVATASFVGPLTPPLGFPLTTDAWLTGYIQVNHTGVKAFLVCDSLSFYFAIASIMLAMIPSFTIPQEALPLEVRIANRVVRVAVVLLFLSIAFVICAFSAATIAVVPESRWHYKVLAVVSTSLGSLVCLIVLCLFLLRLMRLMTPNAGWVKKLTNSFFFPSKKQSIPGHFDV